MSCKTTWKSIFRGLTSTHSFCSCMLGGRSASFSAMLAVQALNSRLVSQAQLQSRFHSPWGTSVLSGNGYSARSRCKWRRSTAIVWSSKTPEPGESTDTLNRKVPYCRSLRSEPGVALPAFLVCPGEQFVEGQSNGHGDSRSRPPAQVGR